MAGTAKFVVTGIKGKGVTFFNLPQALSKKVEMEIVSMQFLEDGDSVEARGIPIVIKPYPPITYIPYDELDDFFFRG